MVKTTDAERVCVSPPGLQAAIDQLVVTFLKGRSFVRCITASDDVCVHNIHTEVEPCYYSVQH